MSARRTVRREVPPARAVLSPSDVAGKGGLASRLRGRLRVGGRAGERDGARVTLHDAFAALKLVLRRDAAEAPLERGDLVVVEGTWRGGTLQDAVVVARSAPRTDHADAAAETDVARFTARGVGQNLAARATALEVVRQYFARERFLEVETPVRVQSPGLDAYVDAIPAEGGWLITSPELHMKRLLVGGLPRIFQIARATRANEDGRLHQSEFTLVEWYRAFAGMENMVADTEALVSRIVHALSGSYTARVDGGRKVDVRPPFARLTVRDAFRKHAGVSDAADLAATDESRYFQTFVDHVEPGLSARRRATILCEFPITQAALARPCAHDPTVAERFEVYVGGVELCNGFGELTDAAEQRRRFEAEHERRRRAGAPLHPIDERFLSALERGLPPSGGNALGFDRLLMVALGATDIADVIAFPRETAVR